MTHQCLPETDHLDLPEGAWADLRRRLTHGQAQEVEQAQLMADYDTRGEMALAIGLSESALSGAPKEWRDKYYQDTVSTIRYALESYETNAEAALSTPEKRRQMADATLRLNEVFVKVYVADWSFGDLAEADAGAVRLISRRAQRSWNEWQREMRARLKADAGEADVTPSTSTPSS